MTWVLILTGVVVFALTTIASVFWSLYFRYSAAGHPHRAALADLGIVGCGALNVVTYTQNHWMLIPLMAGTYVGTVIGVRRKIAAEGGA